MPLAGQKVNRKKEKCWNIVACSKLNLSGRSTESMVSLIRVDQKTNHSTSNLTKAACKRLRSLFSHKVPSFSHADSDIEIVNT